MVVLKPIILDEIFTLNKLFRADTRKEKINGGIGVYLDEAGSPFVLPVVKKAIKLLDFSNFNYLPIAGNQSFLENTARLALGEKLYNRCANSLAKQGVVGGSNGLFLAGCLIKEFDPKPRLIISKPTWENHTRIFTYLGFEIIEYNQVDENYNFNFSSFSHIIDNNRNAYILIQGGLTHNPTGVNLSVEQWQKIIKQIKKNHQQIIFDFAYMGLGQNLEKDSWPLRFLIENNIPLLIIISYSKNMTLYQHRVGALLVNIRSEKTKETIESYLQKIFRIVNSNPPALGESIIEKILADKQLKEEWTREISEMVLILNKRRKLFVSLAGERFKHIGKEKGLFSLLYLNKQQIEILRQKYGIYLLTNSRINFGGISQQNIPKIAKAILESTRC